MTALASRRRRDTWLATGLIVGLLTIAGVLTLVGARTLADSTLGREVVVFDDSPTLRLPHTATAFLGVVGDDGCARPVVTGHESSNPHAPRPIGCGVATVAGWLGRP